MKIVPAKWFNLGLALAPLFALGACSDNTGRVSFSVTSGSSAAPAASVVAGSGISASASQACTGTSISDGTNTLCITSVELVLREVELKRQDVAGCDAIPGNDDCEEFETGPTLVTLPLGSASATAQVTVVDVPNGTFNAVEFEIHKVDAAEATALNFPAGISIRVRGTFNANPAFEFVTDVDAKEEAVFAAPMTISGGSANVDLKFDISKWFKNASGTTLMDPATADKSVVDNNIKASFEAFEDDNHDGIDDHK